LIIEDRRAASELKTHMAAKPKGQKRRCERWYGDETFQPSKLVVLKSLLHERLRAGTTITLKVDRFDTIEYCEQSKLRAVAGSRKAYLNSIGNYYPQEVPSAPGGDTFRIHIEGDLNGRPFAVSRSFDYSGITFSEWGLPGSSPEYRKAVLAVFEQIADDIAALGDPSTQAR